MRSFISSCTVLAALILAPACGVASTTAIITLLDGSGSLISGVKGYTLAAGYRLKDGDIIELNEHSLMQIEFGEGTAVAFSGKSRAMLFSEKQDMVKLFLLRGVVKAAVAENATPVKIETPLFDIEVANATAVAMVSSGEAQLFAEVGEVKLDKVGAGRILKEGEYCALKSGLSDVVMSGLPPSFVQALPVEFREALPKLLREFKDRSVPQVEPREFGYNEVDEWLNSVPQVRRLLVIRWKSKAQDPHFRKALVLGIDKHPEWKEVLFPKKHQPGRHKKDSKRTSWLIELTIPFRSTRGYADETDRKV